MRENGDVMTIVRELTLASQNLERRVRELEASSQKKAQSSRWLSPLAVERESEGRYTAYAIRRRINAAIDSPSSTKLKQGTHFSKVSCGGDGHRWIYKVRWPDFDNIMQEEADGSN